VSERPECTNAVGTKHRGRTWGHAQEAACWYRAQTAWCNASRARGKGVAKVLGKADARLGTRRGIRKNVLGSPLARFEAEWISTSTPTVPGG
jgi:hypothetical protein